MYKISSKQIIDVIPYKDDCAIIAEKIPIIDSTQYKVRYSAVNFKEKTIDVLTKSVYLLKKYGPNFERISEQLPNFVICDSAILNNKRILALYPNGEAGIFNNSGDLEWNGIFEYQNKIIKFIALDNNYFWSICEEENCVLRYSSQTMNVDLRIGSKDSNTFNNPKHISCEKDKVYVCCDNNKVRVINSNDLIVSDYLTFNDSIEKFYKFGDYAIVTMHNGTFVLENNE